MRNLYESILDNDEQIDKRVENSIAQTCIDFLSHSEFWKFCDYEIKGSDLHVVCKKNYREFKGFYIVMIGDDANFDKRPDEHATIPMNLLEHTYFDRCDFVINVSFGEIPTFLSNCKGCNIHLTDANDKDLQEAAKLLKDTKGNNIIIDGMLRGSDGGVKYYDYSLLNNIDFGKCAITLNNCAWLESLKGLKVKAIILQTWNHYGIRDFNANKVDSYALKNLLKDNDFTSFGIIDQFVQYTDWLVKDGDEYRWRVLKTGASIRLVPKIGR